MKYIRLIMVVVLAMLALQTATAKKTVVPRMYMFGFAASFADTIVHFTDIQSVDSVWVESKNGFLLGRDLYSGQLHAYLTDGQQMPHRTCVVFYDKKRQRLEKKLLKMRRLYSVGRDGKVHYDMRHLADADFRFIAVDMSDPEEEELTVVKSGGQTPDAQKDEDKNTENTQKK